ncbi:hypothetical protein [Spiroplasma endosymbiont of Crioceris asparagi]|uniref:hypothetical protein n=1 Tax=Spiroplasma endosymbiont of Crioceris asparagi TaxID=3066286 RepID=UPI0030D2DA51
MEFKILLCIIVSIISSVSLVALTMFLIWKIKHYKLMKYNSFNNVNSSFGFKKWSKPVSFYALSILWLTLLLIFLVSVAYAITYS